MDINMELYYFLPVMVLILGLAVAAVHFIIPDNFVSKSKFENNDEINGEISNEIIEKKQ